MKNFFKNLKYRWDLLSGLQKAMVYCVSTLIVIAGILTPVIIVIQKNASNYVPFLSMWVPRWETDEGKKNAITTLVNEYNENNSEDDYDVEIVWIDDYQNVINGFRNYIQSGKELPDLYTSYPDATAVLLSEYVDPNIPSMGTYALDLSTTDPYSNLNDQHIVSSRLDSQKNFIGYEDNSLYFLPLTGSSESLNINAPLLTYFLGTYVQNGGAITYENDTVYSNIRDILDASDGRKDGYIGRTDDKILVHDKFGQENPLTPIAPITTQLELENLILEAFNALQTENTLDYEAIESIFNNSTPNTSITSSVLLGDWIFSDIQGLYNLGDTLINDVFDNIYGDPSSGLSYTNFSGLGLQSPENWFYTMSEMAGASYLSPENNILFINDNNTIGDISDDYVDYSFLSIDNQDISEGVPSPNQTEGYKTGEQVFDFMSSSLENNTLWMPSTSSGDYSSTLLYQHRMFFTIDTTSTVNYYYDNSTVDNLNQDEVVFLSSPSTFGFNPNLDLDGIPNPTPITSQTDWEATDKLYKSQGPSIGAINQEDVFVNEQSKRFLNWLFTDEDVIPQVNGPFVSPTEYFSLAARYISGSRSVITNDGNPSYVEEVISAPNNGSGVWVDEIFEDGVVDADGTPIDPTLIGPTIAYQNYEDANNNPSSYLTSDVVGPNTGTFRSKVEIELKTWSDNKVEYIPDTLQDWVFGDATNEGLRTWAINQNIISIEANQYFIINNEILISNKSKKNT